ncbi:MAG: hypothetical protein ABSC87_06665 [Halobacteriota archaeon]|jgi:hypothetical protein
MDDEKYYELINGDENEHNEVIKTLGFERYVAMLSVVHSFSQDGLDLTMTEEPTTKEAMFFTFIQWLEQKRSVDIEKIKGCSLAQFVTLLSECQYIEYHNGAFTRLSPKHPFDDFDVIYSPLKGRENDAVVVLRRKKG